MEFIIFERTNFVISEDNKYTFSVKYIDGKQRSFYRFINSLVERSKAFSTYINVYRVYKDHNVNKVAWIKCGELFTL